MIFMYYGINFNLLTFLHFCLSCWLCSIMTIH
nr:MAG TPA_asm: hypothetical protein [Caudoviricetes sp.]